MCFFGGFPFFVALKFIPYFHIFIFPPEQRSYENGKMLNLYLFVFSISTSFFFYFQKKVQVLVCFWSAVIPAQFTVISASRFLIIVTTVMYQIYHMYSSRVMIKTSPPSNINRTISVQRKTEITIMKNKEKKVESHT